jgi:cytosine/adenosine deaminase-related metal-dependent hydrolase
VKKYRDAGVRTGLGVDGSASNDGSNLLIEVREAMLLARLKIGLLPPRARRPCCRPPIRCGPRSG